MSKTLLLKMIFFSFTILSSTLLFSQDTITSKYTTTKTETDIEYTPYPSKGKRTSTSYTTSDGHQHRRVYEDSNATNSNNRSTSRNVTTTQQSISTVERKTTTPEKITEPIVNTAEIDTNVILRVDTTEINKKSIEKVEPKTLPISLFKQKQK